MNSAGEKTVNIERARKIMHRVLKSAGARNVDMGALLRERERHIASGDTALAGEVSRTMEDLAGHWLDGELVDASAIAEASRLTLAMRGERG